MTCRPRPAPPCPSRAPARRRWRPARGARPRAGGGGAQEGRELGVARRAPQVNHHVLGDARRQRLAALLGDQMQREVDARGDAGARGERPVDHEDAVVDHLRPRRQSAQRRAAARGAWCSGEFPSRPARAASSAPEQIVIRRCGVSAAASALAEDSLEPLARWRRSPASPGRAAALGWPTSTTQVGASQPLGQRLEVGEREPHRGRCRSPPAP